LSGTLRFLEDLHEVLLFEIPLSKDGRRYSTTATLSSYRCKNIHEVDICILIWHIRYTFRSVLHKQIPQFDITTDAMMFLLSTKTGVPTHDWLMFSSWLRPSQFPWY